MISDLKIFPVNAFETDEFWFVVGVTAISHLLQMKNYTFL